MALTGITFSIFALIVVILAVVIIFFGVVTVPQGMEYTIERFGRYIRTLGPGLHVVRPVIDRVGKKIKMMEQVIDVPSQDVITQDNALVEVDGVVFYQILDAAKAAYEVDDLPHAIYTLVMTNIRTVMGSMELDHLLSHRDEINVRLLSVIDEATTPWGVKVTRIEIKDISTDEDLEKAMSRQLKAERERRAVVLEAEGARRAAIERAEGEKRAAILTAEGKKQAAFLEAEAREREAQAEARATHVLSKAIEQGNTQAVNYFVAQKYIEALGLVASADNQKVVFMPLEASGVIGSIAGITELFNNSRGPTKSRGVDSENIVADVAALDQHDQKIKDQDDNKES
ncbi:MAG TPA: paraslipin [Gammaproteobacteria bacterium]|nr:paraslipin [Gammaproteobacteria bacterium]